MTDPLNDLHVRVINLDDSRDRWGRMVRRLEAAGLPAARLPAVDGRVRSAESFAGYDDAKARRLMGRALLGAELGCYASHVAFLHGFVSSGRPHGLVLEDDADVPGATIGRLRRALTVLAGTENWDVANCGAAPRRFYRAFGPDEGVGLVRAYYFPMRTTALLWSRPGAQRFLARHQRIVQPIDLELRDFVGASGRGLALRPPLFPALGADSTISAPDGPRRSKRRTPAYRMRVLGRRFRENGHALVGWALQRKGGE